MDHQLLLSELADDTTKGLSAQPKFLLSKYFYDEHGSKLFREIMLMPEYYLTDCEMEIIETHKQTIFEIISNPTKSFELIELGAGDGMKTKILLAHFFSQNADFRYIPVDISASAVRKLENEISSLIPELRVNGRIGDYFQLLEEMGREGSKKKLLMFLGSTIGNMNHEESLDFLGKLRAVMQTNDLLLIGFDLKKDPEVIKKAYSDPHGITAAFNLNLLQRINDALEADFNLEHFRHVETYDPDTGTAKSYLISQTRQQVHVSKLDKTFTFEKDEPIYTEMSQKYDEEMIQNLADHSGFEVVRNFTDRRHYFLDSIWKLKDKN
jgi:L-histidine Nalpha-methyltransferase